MLLAGKIMLQHSITFGLVGLAFTTTDCVSEGLRGMCPIRAYTLIVLAVAGHPPVALSVRSKGQRGCRA